MKRYIVIPACLILLVACMPQSTGLEGGAGPGSQENPTSIPAMPAASSIPENIPQSPPTWTPELSHPAIPETPTPFTSPYTAGTISPIYFGIFHDFILLGAYSSGQWLQAEDVYGLLYEDAVYDFYFDREYIGAGTAHVRQPVRFGPPGYCNYIPVDQSVMGGEPPSFALRQGQSAALRPVEEIPVDTPLYVDAVAEWLTLQEVPAPTVKITRILRVDLEGDGADEVLVSASYFLEESGHMVVVGDYSLVLMRKVIGGQVYTVPLVQDVYYGTTPILRFPPAYYLDNVFDLNGDGRYEIIVAGTWWEGSGYYVYEARGINTMEVLRLMCGYVVQE